MAALLLVGPGGLATSARAEDDGFSFDIVEEAAQDTDRARLDKARDLLADERYDEKITIDQGLCSCAVLVLFPLFYFFFKKILSSFKII